MFESVAQLLLTLGIEPHASIVRRLVRGARSALVRVEDPKVLYELAPGRTLWLPLSHELPYYRRLYPLYAQNIVDVGRLILDKYPDATCVDVGANVGDSALLLQLAGEIPVLCVEGDQGFLQYLRLNTKDLPVVEVAAAFVGSPGAKGRVLAGRGTARLSLTADGKALPFKSLPQILTSHQRFERPRLLKIDTDGMDIGIVQDNMAWIATVRPVLFLEYDPALSQLSAADSAAFWRVLREAGYAEGAFYQNTGELLTVADLSNVSLLEDLHFYYSGGMGAAYADVCLFTDDDHDLVAALRADRQNT